MKKMTVSLVVYLLACFIALILPASEGYNTFAWKIFVGQLYAIPISGVVFVILILLEKKKRKPTVMP
ncbi:DUF4017 family protein [Alteribacter aurantiacus]|uniref:DUF4017 family protein n=1 Tax=Alteribacter aurantiacus TaxID=254410 RepID=UPI000479DC70|nr:DUF4017 family protein [Alteribacter aurantiacus]